MLIHLKSIVKYLGRYLVRAPIAEYKITYYDNEKVTFSLMTELHPKSWTQDWRCSFFVGKLTKEDKIEIYENKKYSYW